MTPSRETARLLLAKLSPHVTSAGNVGLVAEALRIARNEALEEASIYAEKEYCGTMGFDFIRNLKERP